MLRLLLVAILLIPAIGAAENVHPIDADLDKCLEGLSGNSPMANCAYKALEAWDVELNRVYKDLMSELTSEGQKKLRNSQRQWLKYRDSEIDFISTMYNRRRFYGSMYIPIQAMNKLMVTKRRVNELSGYLATHQ